MVKVILSVKLPAMEPTPYSKNALEQVTES